MSLFQTKCAFLYVLSSIVQNEARYKSAVFSLPKCEKIPRLCWLLFLRLIETSPEFFKKMCAVERGINFRVILKLLLAIKCDVASPGSLAQSQALFTSPFVFWLKLIKKASPLEVNWGFLMAVWGTKGERQWRIGRTRKNAYLTLFKQLGAKKKFGQKV